jgi:Phage tail assembly chaperone protein
MLIYHYNRETGFYCGANEAEPDPMELELARQTVYQPLAAAAASVRAAAVAAAIAAFDLVAAGPDVSAEEIEAAAGVRDLAIDAAGQVERAELQDAVFEASKVKPEHWLIPANATATQPPAFGFDEVAVWADGVWSLRPADQEPDPEPEPEPEPDPEGVAGAIRLERTRRIARARWLVDRHRDELDLGRPTTLTAGQYQAVLQYIQDLRDVPEQPTFPAEVSWPELDPALLSPAA